MIGRALEFLWMLAFWFFIVGVFLVPLAMSYWRHNEKQRAEQTEKTLESLGFDTTNSHIWDA